MQTCFETGDDKLCIQIKSKIICCPHKFATGTPNIRKIRIGCCGFCSTCIEYDINKMFTYLNKPAAERCWTPALKVNSFVESIARARYLQRSSR